MTPPTTADLTSTPIEEWRSTFWSFVQCTLSLVPVGYAMTCLNVPQLLFEPLVNETLYNSTGLVLDESTFSILWSLVIAAQSLGAMFSLFITVPLVTHYGTRRTIMLLANLFSIVGVIITTVWPVSFSALFIGRLLIGVHDGLVAGVLPVYISHISSQSRTSANSLLIHVMICVGISIGALVSLESVLGHEEAFSWLLAIPGVFSIVQIFMSPWVPDPPGSQMNFDEKKESTKFYCGPNADLLHLDHMRGSVESIPQKSVVQVLFSRSENHWPVILSALFATATNMSGSGVQISYSTTILVELGVTSSLIDYIPAISGLISAVGTLLAVALIQHCRRRTLVLITFTAVVLLDIAWLIVSFTLPSTAGMFTLIVTMLIFVVFYTAGPAPLTWCMPTELAKDENQAATVAITSFVYWLTAAISSVAFYPLYTAFGPWAYLLFIIPMTIITAIFAFKLPETKIIENQIEVERTPLLSSNDSQMYHG